jgi:multimeric flavodoxin WrbA
VSKPVVINGSPRMEKGHTAMVLAPFIQGMEDAGSDVQLFYASRINTKPCSCGEMYCWYRVPGECCFKDDMQSLYPRLRQADILILATPVYVPLPGAMQDVLNRLCPLLEPLLETRGERTRARFREDVKIRKFVLVSTGGWWEKENMSTVLRIVEELAQVASVEFAGAVLRPHAFLMKQAGKLTEYGAAVLSAARRAGYELVKEGAMNQDTLDAISRPLISEAELRERYNQMLQQ